jgi:hypothetical protein
LIQRVESAQHQSSLGKEVAEHWLTLSTGFLIIVGTAELKVLAGPEVVLGPFYILGCVIPTLVISRRWGTIAAVICTLAATALKIPQHLDPVQAGVILWNASMRFLFFEAYVVLFDLVRIAMSQPRRPCP